jgi:hypothetical protein
MSKLLVQLLPKSATKYLRIVKVFVDYTKANLYRLGLKKKAYRPYFYRFFPYMSHRVIDEDDKNIRWGLAFSEYLQGVSPPVSLVWAATPMPGNFGDWMSPYIIQKVTGRGIKFVNELYFRKAPHIVSLGSIVSCANKDSVVLGSGINSVKDCISQNANLVSVRGRYTGIAAKHCDLKYGDPGFIISDLYKPKIVDYKTPTHAVVLVRHINHIGVNIDFSGLCDELSINAARPVDIETFIDELNSYELVITSAMHCFITCISYGIDVILVNFTGKFNKIPGDGIKYLDCLSGVNLKEIKPVDISSNEDFWAILIDREKYIYREKIKDMEKKIIRDSVFEAVSAYDALIAEL